MTWLLDLQYCLVKSLAVKILVVKNFGEFGESTWIRQNILPTFSNHISDHLLLDCTWSSGNNEVHPLIFQTNTDRKEEKGYCSTCPTWAVKQ